MDGGIEMGRASAALSYGGQGAATGAAIGSIIPGVGTAIGGAVGGTLGAIGGALFGGESDEEKKRREQYDQLMNSNLRGDIDPVARRAMEQSLARRFGQLRGEVGAGFARRGTMSSDIAGNVGMQAVQGEREALADTLARYQQNRQAQGTAMYQGQQAQQQAESAETAATLGSIAQLAAFLYFNPRQAPQQMAAQQMAAPGQVAQPNTSRTTPFVGMVP